MCRPMGRLSPSAYLHRYNAVEEVDCVYAPGGFTGDFDNGGEVLIIYRSTYQVKPFYISIETVLPMIE
jgi:hypothetical protein